MIYINATKAAAIVFAILTFAWCLFIWSFSLNDAESSDVQSNKVVELVNDTIERVSGTNVDADNHIVRKSAHFFEFSVLGVLIFVTLYLFCVRSLKKSYMLGAFVSIAVAVTDELLQLTSPGRSSQLTDVILDATGALAAFSACLIFVRVFGVLRRKRSHRS